MNIITGIFQFLRQAYCVGTPRYSTNEIPDLDGKVVIVTGGSSGIGKEIVKALLEHNAKVYVAARNEAKSKETIDQLYASTGKKAIFLHLDLADLHSVKRAATEFLTKETQLHLLFNNGGVMVPPVSDVTSQQYDLQFGTNVLGHFYLTRLLLSVLLSTARRCNDGSVRVINVSSSAHYVGFLWNPVDFATLKDGPKRRRWMTEFLYTQSKFGNVVFSNELARRHGELVSIAVNPGNLKNTALGRHASRWWSKLYLALLLIYPPEYGALSPLWSATSPQAASLNGKYVGPWCKVYQPQPATLDPDLGRDLWTWMEDQITGLQNQ